MAKGKITERTIRLHEKRAKALELRRRGVTYDQIALQLGLASRSGAHQLVSKGLAGITAESAEQLRQIEAERLDNLHSAYWNQALNGNERAAVIILRIMERRAKLCGLDAPAKLIAANVSLNYENMLRELAGMREANPALLNAEETS